MVPIAKRNHLPYIFFHLFCNVTESTVVSYFQSKSGKNPFEPEPSLNPFEDEMSDEDGTSKFGAAVKAEQSKLTAPSPFQGIISKCFECHLDVYIESQERCV